MILIIAYVWLIFTYITLNITSSLPRNFVRPFSPHYYCMYKKSWHISNRNVLYEVGEEFFDVLYCWELWKEEGLLGFILLCYLWIVLFSTPGIEDQNSEPGGQLLVLRHSFNWTFKNDHIRDQINKIKQFALAIFLYPSPKT